jgi:protein-S-isoprenylcysteine O-methyltransferase Ste14
MKERNPAIHSHPTVWQATEAMDDFIAEELDPRARGDLLAVAVACLVFMGILGVSMAFISKLAPILSPFIWLGWGFVMALGAGLLGLVSGTRTIRSKLRDELLAELLENQRLIDDQ